MRKLLIKTLLTGLMFTAFCIILSAQSLYGAGVSPDDGLVRIFNYGAEEQTIEIGSRTVTSKGFGSLTPYFPVGPGMYVFEHSDEWSEIIVSAGTYYTIAIGDKKVHIFKDVEHDNAAKAQIYFYNLIADQSISLNAEPGSIEVIGGVTAGSSEEVQVNPVSANFILSIEGNKLADLGVLPLTRGGSVSIFLYGDLDSPAAVVLESRVDIK